MLDERRAERNQLIYHLKVYNEDTGWPIGYLYDLTVDGAKLLTEEQLSADEVLHLVVKLPDGLYKDPYIRLKAKPVWHHDGDRRHYHDYGFQFINLEFHEKVRISEFIEEFGVAI